MTRSSVVLVCGPPCSGKSTYVRANMQPSDMVVDYDDIARQLGSPVSHGHDYKYHRRVEAIVERCVRDIEAGKQPRAWVIRSLPSRADRDQLAQRINAEVVLIDAPDSVLMERARARPNPKGTQSAILNWRIRARV